MISPLLLSCLSEVSLCSSAEGRRTEEGSLCPGHAGHETLPAIWTERARLGCWTFEQQTAELLLLRRPWGVSGKGGKLWDGCCWGNNQGEGGLWLQEGCVRAHKCYLPLEVEPENAAVPDLPPVVP